MKCLMLKCNADETFHMSLAGFIPRCQTALVLFTNISSSLLDSWNHDPVVADAAMS